jgi:ribosomal protein S12 methylthiotransferase accessory factor
MDMEITFPGGKKVDALYKGFTIRTDQPKHEGGGSEYPTPFDLFLASMGTCAGIYVLSFCQERNLPISGLKLILRTVRDSQTRMISRVDIEIRLPAGFPDKYKNALISAAGLCAVKKHMNSPPSFNIFTMKSD